MIKVGSGLCRSVCVAFLMMAAPAVAGIRVQPMSYDLATSGSKAQQNIRVENTGNRPAPVEVRVERRKILPDGSESRTPAEDDFMIFPPQGIVPANGFQTFRVQYVGDPSLAQTALYTVTVAQLPLDTTGAKQSGVQLLFNLGTLAAVSPAGAEPKLLVSEVAPSEQAGKLKITVRNDGNGYARLRSGKWTLTSKDGKSEALEGEALHAALEQPLIEPGTVRIIHLPVGSGFTREGAKAEFQLSAPAN